MTLLVFLTALGTSSGQSYTMSTDNCTITPNVITFDVMMTNNGPADMHINSTVIRMTHGTALLPTAGTNTVTFSYVNDGQSVIPLSFPPNASPTFVYTAGPRQWQVSTGTSIYLNGSCTAPLVLPGQTVKLGRFALTLSNNMGATFNPGAQAQLTFHTTAAMVIYLNCNSVTSLASALTKTLIAPCALTVPSSCAITASIQSQIDVLCFGGTGSATATSTGGVEPVTYSWNTTPVQTAPGIRNLAVGEYTALISDTAACGLSVTTVVGEGPDARPTVDIGSDLLICPGSTIPLLIRNFSTYQWQDGSTDSLYLITSSGKIFLTVANSSGCRTSDSLIVEEDCLSDILFPNAFTPNEDGINEIFSGVGSEPENFKLRIFDRWGELIFESNSILNGWDGKYNGHSVHDGVYVYQSIFTIAKNNEIEKTGKVVLIR